MALWPVVSIPIQSSVALFQLYMLPFNHPGASLIIQIHKEIDSNLSDPLEKSPRQRLITVTNIKLKSNISQLKSVKMPKFFKSRSPA